MREPILEASSLEHTIESPLIAVRLDGVGFSTLTKHPMFDAPFDADFTRAMNDAAIAVMRDAGGPSCFAYTQSDEITAVFDLSRTPWFRARAFKIATVCASLVATEFVASLRRAGKVIERPVAFDARIVADDGSGVIDEIIAWRLADCAINSTTSHARSLFGSSMINGVSTRDMRVMCAAQAQRPWGELPASIKFGTFVVREAYNGPNDSTRHRWVCRDAEPGARTTTRPGECTVVEQAPYEDDPC